MKRSLHIGINNYTRSPLKGCVNDATNWALFYSGVAKFDRVKTLFDRDAKLSKVTAAIRSMLEESAEGDEVVITYSGHGTQVPCAVKPDEKDGYDEAWVLFDGIWVDDEIADLLNTMPNGVSLSVVSDSCHSGSVSRGDPVDGESVPRCIPYVLAPVSQKAYPSRRMFSRAGDDSEGQTQMNHVLLAGAMPDEYSWDCSFNGVPWGALSYHALAILNAPSCRGLTWDQLFFTLKNRLPSKTAPQHPQLEGPDAMKRRRIVSR